LDRNWFHTDVWMVCGEFILASVAKELAMLQAGEDVET
jgi:hypothetical protein